ncbi:apolipoprotein N-acyltransferase [Candidatus Electronema sp. PJ]|uniref:apolipoprotein N-acyltransferase n=1 Tax=Candidatus Electronema sp. PJ TaxID=3401572 RepID=UPI003AA91F42
MTTPNAPPHKVATLAAPGLSALLLALAMPGWVGCWPLLFIALIPLLWAARTLPSAAQSGCMGLFCSLLYHVSLLCWIVIVLQRYGGLHTTVATGVLFLLAVYMAAYTAFFCILVNRLTTRPGKGLSVTILLIAPVAWVGLDVARGWLLTGMPWMDLGYGFYHQPLLIQAADLGGHHLITFFIVQINALLYWLLDRIFSQTRTAKRQYVLAVMVCLSLYCAGGYSMLRYQQVDSEAATAEQLVVATVQGNIDQAEKWSPTMKDETVERYLSLSNKAVQGGERVHLVVWPETALPFYPHREPLMSRVRDFVKDKQIYLITGSPFFTVTPDRHKEQGINLRPVEYFNSALLLDHSGTLIGRYNKQHLVPFGEYVPLRDFLWFIRPLVELVGDFTPGNSFKPLDADKIKAGALICFESIFPNIARQETAEGANLLVSLTNDAWYGKSSAPQQSWAMTILRAVENRRSLVRAANTGISGFVAPTGAVSRKSDLFTEEALTDNVALMTGQTVFGLGGHWFGTACLAFTGLLLLQYLWLAKKQRKKIFQRKQELLRQQQGGSNKAEM